MIRGIDFDGVLVESVDVKTHAYVSFFEWNGQGVVSKVIDCHIKNGETSRFLNSGPSMTKC